MGWKVLIAHEASEEAQAELLAEPIRRAGYEVVHRGTVGVGDSIELETTLALQSGGPVVLCGTQRAVGSRWAWQLVDAARATAGQQRIFVVQMERDAFVEPLARGGAVAHVLARPGRGFRRAGRRVAGELPAADRSDGPPPRRDDRIDLRRSAHATARSSAARR